MEPALNVHTHMHNKGFCGLRGQKIELHSFSRSLPNYLPYLDPTNLHRMTLLSKIYIPQYLPMLQNSELQYITSISRHSNMWLFLKSFIVYIHIPLLLDLTYLNSQI